LSFLVENGGAEVNNKSFEVEGFQNLCDHAAHVPALSRFVKKTAAPQKSTAVMWSGAGLGIASKRLLGLVR